MMKKRITEWLMGKQFFGVSLYLNKGETWKVDLVEIKRSRKEIKILDKVDAISNSRELWVKLPTHAKISLNLSGDGILIKEVRTDQLEDGIDAIMPNVNKDDFIVQYLCLSNGRSLLVMMRRDLLTSILKEFTKRKLWVVDLYLGPVSLKIIKSFFGNNVTLIHLPEMELGIEAGDFTYFKRSNEVYSGCYSVLGEELLSRQVIPFSAAVSAVANTNMKNQTAEISALSKEFFAKEVFRKGGFTALVFLFMVLLLNFILFDSLRKKQLQLSSQVETGRNLLIQLDELRTNFTLKEDFLKKSGLNENSRLSFYADRLASELPAEVRLTSLEINPLMKKIRVGKEIDFGLGIILIKGETMHPIELNRWIQNLKSEDWVAKLEKQEYFLKQKDKSAEFIIEIRVQ